MKLIVEISAYRLKEDTIVNLNAVDKKGYAGQWVVTHPDGKMEILDHEDVKARAATKEDLDAILETEPVELEEKSGLKEVVKNDGGVKASGSNKPPRAGKLKPVPTTDTTAIAGTPAAETGTAPEIDAGTPAAETGGTAESEKAPE